MKNWIIKYLLDLHWRSRAPDLVFYIGLDRRQDPAPRQSNNITEHKSSGKLKTSLEKRQKKLWKKRVAGVTDHSLERKLAAIAIQEPCLEEWTYKNYSYNALAKHMLLNE